MGRTSRTRGGRTSVWYAEIVKPTKKADDNSDPERSEDYERFESLTKALMAVPKSEIRREAEEYEQAKETRPPA